MGPMRAMGASCFIFASILFVFSFAAIADSSRILTQTTTADGITVNFRLPQLHVTQAKPDIQFKNAGGGVYHAVKYSECDWIQEPGYPRLPATRLLLAVPADAQLNNADVSVNAGTSRTRSGVRLLLTQKEVPVSTEGVSVKAGPLQTDSGTGHLQNKKETNPNSGSALYPTV